MFITAIDKTLTVDANIINYYFSFSEEHSLPEGLRVRRMENFCHCIIDKYPIAINDFIRAEYLQVTSRKTLTRWLTIRNQYDLVIEVNRTSLPNKIKICLRDNYGFDCRSKDVKYLETCRNTNFKHFITENREHFARPHRSRRRISMPGFLKHKLNITICTIDECCEILLNGQDDE